MPIDEISLDSANNSPKNRDQDTASVADRETERALDLVMNSIFNSKEKSRRALYKAEVSSDDKRLGVLSKYDFRFNEFVPFANIRCGAAKDGNRYFPSNPDRNHGLKGGHTPPGLYSATPRITEKLGKHIAITPIDGPARDTLGERDGLLVHSRNQDKIVDTPNGPQIELVPTEGCCRLSLRDTREFYEKVLVDKQVRAIDSFLLVSLVPMCVKRL